MADQALFLGIDGGGTKCRARLTDAAGKKLGEGVAGAANIRLGLDAAWSAILGATDQALGEAALHADAMGRIHAGFGLAGVCGPEDVDFLLTGKSPFASVRVETDAHTACLGAFAGQDGAILIVGTGSVGYALIGGVAHSIGGWGFEISDDGSGAAMGRAAIRAAVRAHDGLSAASPLTQAIIAKLGPPARIVEWATSAKPGNYASFAPLVLEHALRDDPVALEIIRHGAMRLDAHVKRLRELGSPANLPDGRRRRRDRTVSQRLGARDLGGAQRRRDGRRAVIGETRRMNVPMFHREALAGDAPLYLQLARHVRKLIADGQLQVEQALPAERELADRFGVSRVTVRKALQELVDEGLLQQRARAGTYVSRGVHVVQALSALTGFTEDMRSRGLEPSSHWLKRGTAHRDAR